ncbi:MAG: ketol-acid reductoisomerase [Chthoniobacterales bacterium]|nr:ketol-acid reductoisomerase [Chthoniobacterales bacterium]
MPAKIYTDKDADLKHLQGKTCAMLGFGSQGSAQARNLKDSGINVLIALPSKSKSRRVAQKEGFQVMTTAEVVKKADLLCLALPDLKIPAIFKKEIAPHLRPGMTLLFLHGFVVHYKVIKLRPDINVIMVSPKGGPGPNVRAAFLAGRSVPTAIAVHQDFSKKSKQLALAWAHGIGSKKHDIILTTFAEETESNLFAEQAVICGGLSALIQKGFETLVEAGISPKLAYLSTLREIKLTTDLIYQSGISGMRAAISETAKYGDLTVGPTIIDASVKKKMQRALKKIQSGQFAKEWIHEYQNGLKNYHTLLNQASQHPIEKIKRKA